MPTFMELSQAGYPIIRSKRRDGAILIATRIPLDDVRLERWGWILTLSSIDGVPIEDDTDTLKNGAGRRFPKIYLLPDIQSYIEKWECSGWEEGYHTNGNQLVVSRNGASIGGQQEQQTQLLTQIKEELQAQLEDNRVRLEEKNVEYFEVMQHGTTESYNVLLERSKANYAETSIQLEKIDHALDETSRQAQEQSRKFQEEAEQIVKIVTEEIKNTASLYNQQTLVTLEEQSRLSRQDTIKQLEETREEMKKELDSFSAELRSLGEQVKQTLDELNPDIEEELDKTQTADPALTATKMVRKATTQIERITYSHQKMSTKYFDSANEQSKQSFRYAWSLYFAAVGLLVFTVVASVFMAFLQLYGFTIVIGCIGTLGTTIVAVMGALSSFHAKTTEQFAYAQRLLDRRYGSTIANAMIIGYQDDEHKKAALDKIVDSLLRDEIKDVGKK